MPTSLFRAALVLLPLAAIACASSSEEPTQGDDQNVVKTKSGEAGSMCGGIAGLTCKAGLKCRMASNGPDASGTCGSDTAQPGEAGGMCGGIAGIRCKAGLSCDLTGKPFDASGVCAADNAPSTTAVNCQAMPTCQSDEQAVTSCALKDTSCTPRSRCGKTIHCKKAGDATIEGKLVQSFGIGGENTGFSIKTDAGMTELVLDNVESARFVEGRFARAKGKMTTLSGVETHDRPALDVSDLLVCPAAGSINCQPPIDAGNTTCGVNRSWIAKNCDVSFLD